MAGRRIASPLSVDCRAAPFSLPTVLVSFGLRCPASSLGASAADRSSPVHMGARELAPGPVWSRGSTTSWQNLLRCCHSVTALSTGIVCFVRQKMGRGVPPPAKHARACSPNEARESAFAKPGVKVPIRTSGNWEGVPRRAFTKPQDVVFQGLPTHLKSKSPHSAVQFSTLIPIHLLTCLTYEFKRRD
jgi:hypothetical protein